MKELKKTNKDYILSLIFIILCVLFWGYSFISTKIVLTELPPVSIAFFRQVIAVITLFGWLVATRKLSRVTLKHLLLLGVSAFFGIVLYFVFENTGLQFTSASNASIIVAAVPVLTLITEVFFYKLQFTVKMLVCILLSILGVYLVITVNGTLDFSSSTLLGNFLVVGAMVAWVVYTMLNKRLSDVYPSALITAWQSLCSLFLFIPFLISDLTKWQMISAVSLYNLLYLGVCCSALAYFFYVYASKRLGSTTTAAYLNLIPVVSVLFGFFILDEKLTLPQWIGTFLILGSLFVLSRKGEKGWQRRQLKNDSEKAEG